MYIQSQANVRIPGNDDGLEDTLINETSIEQDILNAEVVYVNDGEQGK